MNPFDIAKWTSIVLVILGAINWGLIGAFHFNLVESLIHQDVIVRAIYILIGLAGLFLIYLISTSRRRWW